MASFEHKAARSQALKSSTGANKFSQNEAGYTATQVACGWVGVVIEKVTKVFGQEP